VLHSDVRPGGAARPRPHAPGDGQRCWTAHAQLQIQQRHPQLAGDRREPPPTPRDADAKEQQRRCNSRETSWLGRRLAALGETSELVDPELVLTSIAGRIIGRSSLGRNPRWVSSVTSCKSGPLASSSHA
jgi:hypothetical protein